MPETSAAASAVPEARAATPAPARPLALPPGRAPLRRLLALVFLHPRAALLTLLFGMVGFCLSFVYPWIIGSVVDAITAASTDGGSLEHRAQVLHMAELALATAFLHALVVYGRGHANVHLGDGVVAELRRALFAHLQKLGAGFYTRERTGAILSHVLSDVHEAAALVYTGLIVAGLDAIQLFVAMALLGRLNLKLTAACLVLFPLYGVVFATMGPRVRRASEQLRWHLGRLSGNLSEQIAGQAVVKTCTAEEREEQRFRGQVAHHHSLVVEESHAGHMVASAGEILVHLGTTIVIGYGGWLALGGEMTAGTLTRFLGYILVMFGPVRRFAELNIVYQSSLSAMRRVFRVLDIRPSIVEVSHPRTTPPKSGHVRFEEVRFRYGADDEAVVALDDEPGGVSRLHAASAFVIDGISLEAKPGERIAIVGPSGAGKTSLVSLLPRLYDVTDGRVHVDGTDVRDYSVRALRSAIGIVQQDSFVFSGSIRDNIAYGRPNASDGEIVEAARAAHAHGFIASLPGGYGSWLGERGINLSGGQRQRISIARALLKDPRILILDEATSSLDADSEASVQEALNVLMRGRTCFIIAHRLSTIRNATRIFVLENGRIAESGDYEQLVSRNATFARLVRRQSL